MEERWDEGDMVVGSENGGMESGGGVRAEDGAESEWEGALVEKERMRGLKGEERISAKGKLLLTEFSSYWGKYRSVITDGNCIGQKGKRENMRVFIRLVPTELAVGNVNFTDRYLFLGNIGR